MKPILFFSFSLFLFSCAMKPEVTEEQIAQYNYCKQILLENKTAFIAKGTTAEKRDSLKSYLDAIEKNDFPALLEKYEVEQEQVMLVLLSICEKANAIDNVPSMQETMESADSMLRAMDSIIRGDSVRNGKSH